MMFFSCKELKRTDPALARRLESGAAPLLRALLYEHRYRKPAKDRQRIEAGQVEEPQRLVGCLSMEPARDRHEKQRDACGGRPGKVEQCSRHGNHKGKEQAEDDHGRNENKRNPR